MAIVGIRLLHHLCLTLSVLGAGPAPQALATSANLSHKGSLVGVFKLVEAVG